MYLIQETQIPTQIDSGILIPRTIINQLYYLVR